GSWYGGVPPVVGLFSPSLDDVAPYNATGVTVRDLEVRSPGVGITIAKCIAVTLDGIRSHAGWQGVGSAIGTGAVYDVIVRNDCDLFGRDAAYFGDSQIVRIEGLSRRQVGNCRVRLSGCEGVVRNVSGDVYAGSSVGIRTVPYAVCMIDLDDSSAYASNYLLENLFSDNESATAYPLVVAF